MGSRVRDFREGKSISRKPPAPSTTNSVECCQCSVETAGFNRGASPSRPYLVILSGVRADFIEYGAARAVLMYVDAEGPRSSAGERVVSTRQARESRCDDGPLRLTRESAEARKASSGLRRAAPSETAAMNGPGAGRDAPSLTPVGLGLLARPSPSPGLSRCVVLQRRTCARPVYGRLACGNATRAKPKQKTRA